MRRPLRIELVLARNPSDVQWYQPLALGYLKSYAEKHLGRAAEISILADENEMSGADVVGVSSTSADFARAMAIAAKARGADSRTITVLGGHHVTYLPETMSELFDVGVMGEGEETFTQLLRHLADSGKASPEGLRSIAGLAYHDNGKVVTTPRRPLITPLDAIPLPFRPPQARPYLFSSRGCPYRCTFCSSSAFWEKVRYFTAEYVVAEIEAILRQCGDLRHISIWDDLFIADRGRLRRIARLLNAAGISEKVSFDCAVRANLVDDELCEILKTLNVTAVGFGAESGSDRILQVLAKQTTVEMNQRALDTLHRHGITAGCSFMLGSPGETEAEAASTYEFLLKNIRSGKVAPTSAVNILMPMPGTPMWAQAVSSGLIDPSHFDWGRLSFFASFRNSNSGGFEDWVRSRKQNGSLYMAEATLPESRLYALMERYERTIASLEKQMGVTMTEMHRFERILPPGSLRRNVAKRLHDAAMYPVTRLRGLCSTTPPAPAQAGKVMFPESRLAHRYCAGKGLEIGGSAHNPFGLNSLNVDFTDAMDTVFKQEEVKVCGHALKVDVVAFGDSIPLPDGSHDFVVSSHVFEHFPNPIKALVEWDRLLRPGGVIFMIVPHRDRTFDKDRPRTPLSHIVGDYRSGNTRPHGTSHGHDHVWITQDVVDIVEWAMANLGVNWRIEEVQDVDDKVGNGFTLVIRKLGDRRRA
jgi:anaerobic magnesium-protoporphyrin IX monomethyl ester cyclase